MNAQASLPVIPDSCPACFAMPTQRQHMKELLAAEEGQNRLLFKSLLATLRPLMSEGLPVLPDVRTSRVVTPIGPVTDGANKI